MLEKVLHDKPWLLGTAPGTVLPFSSISIPFHPCQPNATPPPPQPHGFEKWLIQLRSLPPFKGPPSLPQQSAFLYVHLWDRPQCLTPLCFSRTGVCEWGFVWQHPEAVLRILLIAT